MKVLFVEARRNKKIDFQKLIDKAEGIGRFKRVAIASSIQYINSINELEKALNNRGIEALYSKGSKTRHPGQIIGCDAEAALRIKNADAFFIIGDGSFHTLQIALNTEKPVFVLNENTIKKIEQRDLAPLRAKMKSASILFIRESTIGIIVSSKPGQAGLSQAIKIKQKIEKLGKKAFIFLGNTINIYELENFPCKIWVNTSCEGLALDSSRIINIKDAENLLNQKFK